MSTILEIIRDKFEELVLDATPAIQPGIPFRKAADSPALELQPVPSTVHEAIREVQVTLEPMPQVHSWGVRIGLQRVCRVGVRYTEGGIGGFVDSRTMAADDSDVILKAVAEPSDPQAWASIAAGNVGEVVATEETPVRPDTTWVLYLYFSFYYERA